MRFREKLSAWLMVESLGADVSGYEDRVKDSRVQTVF